jgi:uncharacterized membrane protein YhaH (DUF805 family)
MEEANRFAPPGAQVADVVERGVGVQPVRLWPPSGRIGRLRLLAYSAALYLAFIVVSAVLGGFAGATRSPKTALALGVVAFIVYVVGGLVLLIQRSHDMNLSGWWSLAAFVPLVGLLWLVKGGTPGANRWGAPPPPNGLAVRIIGLIFPVVLVVGVIAAIALPAYVDYTKRAQSGVTR